MIYYELQPNESLSVIARRYQVPLKVLQYVNHGLGATKIAPGLVIKIPQYCYRKAPSGYYVKRYIVQKGDTLYNISQRTGIPVSTLTHYNPFLEKMKMLYPGQFIHLVYKYK